MSTPLDHRAQARADRADAAEQRRLDGIAEEERRAKRQRLADQRAAARREQARADSAADRQAAADRRAERSARRAAALTPARVYQRGTLTLVTVSALASLPAQVIHFVSIDPMLLPLPLSLEGAAWVMAAGVAYADDRHLPGWVRWLLRTLVAAFASFAAFINYEYGLSLAAPGGLSPAEARTVGLGLAAVSLLGPLVFEIRQWVSALSTGDEGERARRRHAAARQRHHRKVRRVAARLTSAAPYGTLPAEAAWERAWEIVHGTTEPGMTARLEKRATKAADRADTARTPAAHPPHTSTGPNSAPARAQGPEAEESQVSACAVGVRDRVELPAHTDRTGEPHTPDEDRTAEWDEAELERMRQEARRTYAEAAQAGRTLSARALGEAYGMSESWGRKQIAATRQLAAVS